MCVQKLQSVKMSAQHMLSTYTPTGDTVTIAFRLPNSSKMEYKFSVTEQPKVTVPHSAYLSAQLHVHNKKMVVLCCSGKK